MLRLLWSPTLACGVKVELQVQCPVHKHSSQGEGEEWVCQQCRKVTSVGKVKREKMVHINK